MIRINLIPTKAARKKEGAILQLSVGAGAVLLAVAACWFINGGVDKRIAVEQITQNDLTARINQLKSVIAEVEEFKKRRRDLEAKIGTIKDLNDRRSGPVKFMEEFTTVVPRKTWITSFREAEKQLSLEGIAADGPAVADFIDNLRGSKFFYNVQLIQVQQDTAKQQKFSVTCLINYVPAGGKA